MKDFRTNACRWASIERARNVRDRQDKRREDSTNGMNDWPGAAATPDAKGGTCVVGSATARRLETARFGLDHRREAAGIGDEPRKHDQEQPSNPPTIIRPPNISDR